MAIIEFDPLWHPYMIGDIQKLEDVHCVETFYQNNKHSCSPKLLRQTEDAESKTTSSNSHQVKLPIAIVGRGPDSIDVRCIMYAYM